MTTVFVTPRHLRNDRIYHTNDGCANLSDEHNEKKLEQLGDDYEECKRCSGEWSPSHSNDMGPYNLLNEADTDLINAARE